MPSRKSSRNLHRRRRRPASPRAASPPTSSTACCARSGRSTNSSKAATSARCRSATARWCATSSPPCCGGSARLRHLLGGLLEKGLPAEAPQVEADPADRRRADPVSRCARPCRGRSLGAAGAGRPPRRALCRAWSTPCCASSRATARPQLAALDTAPLDTPEWLMQRWTRTTARRPRAPSRSRTRHEPALDLTVKSDAARHGPTTARRPRAADRHGADGRVGADPAACRLRRRRVVGAGRRRGDAGAAARRRAAAKRSPICAPRRAARPRSLRWPARKSPRSIARARGWRGCAKIWRGCNSMPRWSRPTPRRGRADRSTRCCSTRHAHRPAPSAGIPTFRGSSPRPISPSSPRCRPGCSTTPSTLLKPGGTLVYCTCSLEARGGRGPDRRPAWPQSASCGRNPIRPDEIAGHGELLTPDGELRTLPCHLARSRAPHGRARRLLCGPDRQRHERGLSGWPPCRPSLYVTGAAGRRAPAIRREASASMAGLSIGERARLSLLLARRRCAASPAGYAAIRSSAGASFRARPTAC